MRAIDQLIDCFMHALTDCPMTHLGSSLLNMHYSVLTTKQWRLIWYSGWHSFFSWYCKVGDHFSSVNKQTVAERWGNSTARFDLSMNDTGPVKNWIYASCYLPCLQTKALTLASHIAYSTFIFKLLEPIVLSIFILCPFRLIKLTALVT